MAQLQFSVWPDAREVAIGVPEQEGVITIGGTSAQGAVIAPSEEPRLKRVRVLCDSAAWVTWGADPTAAADGSAGFMMGAENPEYFGIEAGHRLAVIERT